VDAHMDNLLTIDKAGIYYIRFNTENQTITKKILIL